METVIGDISKCIEELKNLLHVGLEDCCDELTRGVVDGIVASQCIQQFTLHNIGRVVICILYAHHVVYQSYIITRDNDSSGLLKHLRKNHFG